MATNPATEMALPTRFGRILMSDACQKIDFHWGRLHIDGSAFSFIALGLASRPPHGIGCRVQHLKKNRGAQYNPTANRIEVPKASFGTNPGEEMEVVHEATHAIADATTKSKMRGELEETAAYVAGALYNINAAASISGPFPVTPTGIWLAAHNVALQIVGNPGYALSPIIASPLRQAVLTSPTYAFLKQTPNYTHDGVSL